MFYRNDSTVDAYPLQLPGCSLDCPLDDFVRITKLSISDDREKECQLPSEGRDKGETLELMTADMKITQLIVPVLIHFLHSSFLSSIPICSLFSVFRSDHQSGGVRLSALIPHCRPPRCYLLAEGAAEQPRIPPCDQPGSRRGVLTEAQAPPSERYKHCIMGQQRWRWTLTHFLMASSALGRDPQWYDFLKWVSSHKNEGRMRNTWI